MYCQVCLYKILVFSPRTRRCFPLPPCENFALDVFSAYAEVFLRPRIAANERKSFLRVRGGVSRQDDAQVVKRQFSPRTRRCFSIAVNLQPQILVFSAYAEVFLQTATAISTLKGFLRVRGGVSLLDRLFVCNDVFSPRTRRCF